MTFTEVFSPYFKIHRWDNSGHARDYLSGLMGNARRKNLERIEQDVGNINYDGLQHFISNSDWDDRKVMERVAAMAEQSLGGHRDSALYLDETSFVKKGTKSVGVQRQYCGRLGKTENCQVGVFAALGRAERVTLIDYRLFLPQSWAQDEDRCLRAGVPQGQCVHKSKPQLALEMVRQARRQGLSFQWVGGDEVYGNAMPDALEDEGETFLMDIARNAHVWVEQPAFIEALDKDPASTGKGRPRTFPSLDESGPQAIKVCDLVAQHFDQQCTRVAVRATTKGVLEAEIWICQVWTCDRERRKCRSRRLVVRRECDGSYKYSITNADPKTSPERLAYMQAQRFWIERAFQDAKSELGMADYEVRGWRGWHHHMTLVCMAMLFLLRERLSYSEQVPLLSCRDIVELLAFYLPRQSKSEELILEQMQKRHQQRTRDQNRYSGELNLSPK